MLPRLLRSVLIAALVACLSPPLQAAEAFDEAEVKAALLAKILRFVDWPEEAFSADSSEFSACTLGQSELAEAIARLLEGEEIAGRQVTWHALEPASWMREAGGCQLLLLAEVDADALRGLRKVEGRYCLLAGDHPLFLESGGMLNFLIEEKRVRFEVNLERLRSAGLKLSAKVLSLASRVLTEFAPG